MTKQVSMPARWRFFESYADAIELIDAQLGRAAAEHFLFAMYEFSSWGRDPELDFSDPTMGIAWALVRPNLEASVSRHTNGAAGGRKKAENRRKRESGQENESAPEMDAEEAKRVRKLTRAMGNVYKATTTIPEFGDDDLLPDCLYDDQAAFMDADHERRRALLQDEIDADEWLGV